MEESQRKGVPEALILAVPCPQCQCRAGRPCKFKSGLILAHAVESNELSFHDVRILTAVKVAMSERFGSSLDVNEKALIGYYAFILLCDSVSANSIKIFSQEYSSADIQQTFVRQAIKALQDDGLLNRAHKIRKQ